MANKAIDSIVDLDEGWSEVDTWEVSGIITAEEALEAEKEAEEAKGKVEDEEQRYALLTQAAQDTMKELAGLLEKVELSTATKEEMERIAEMNEKMELLKSDISVSKSTIKSHNDDMVRSVSKKKIYDFSNAAKARDIRAALHYVHDAEAVDLAFLLDCTGSMGRYIEAAKKSIKEIVARVKHTNPDLKLRIAVVGYRDLTDRNPFEVLDFTSSIQQFEKFVSKLVADGGRDPPEDIAGAVKKANALSWAQASRVVFLIADYPCHGTKYHDYPFPDDDLYPNGTPGICIETELKVLGAKTGKEGAMNLHFGRINAECDIMIRAFAATGIPFEVNDLDDPQKLSRAVTSSVRKSISRSVTASRSRSEHAAAADLIEDEATLAVYKICETMPSKEEWNDIPTRPVNFLCNKPISSVEDLKAPLWFGVVRWGVSASKGTEAKKMLMQCALDPFAQGESRLAYYGRIGVDENALTLPMAGKVFKEFKKTCKSAEVDRKQYLAQMEVSAIANFLAKEYNNTDRPSNCPKIRFLDVIVVETDEKIAGGRYCAEELLPTDEGSFTRFSNNTGFWNEDEINQSLLLFTRFTFEKTGGYLMVTDLQGIRTEDEFILTDPAILCMDKVRFGGTNLGAKFMKKCMDSTNAMMEEYFV
jgi:hypothetical protein